MSSCVFCAIVRGDAPARVVYADDHVLAFLDVRPVRPGHTLVVPRHHIPDLAGLDDETGAAVFGASRRVAGALRTSRIGADGVNVAVNDGSAACQTVFHTHMHVIPRHRGDRLSVAKGFVARRDPDPDGTAAILRAAITPSD